MGVRQGLLGSVFQAVFDATKSRGGRRNALIIGPPAITTTGTSLVGYSLMITRNGAADSAPFNALKA